MELSLVNLQNDVTLLIHKRNQSNLTQSGMDFIFKLKVEKL